MSQILMSIVGAVLGGAAIVGVLVNNNNISELSKDQDSICTLVSLSTLYFSSYLNVNCLISKITTILSI